MAANRQKFAESRREKRAERHRLAVEREREANKARQLAWRAANPDIARARAADYYERNAAEIKRKTKQWSAANAERKLETDRRYHAENRERLNAQRRAWKVANPDRVRAGIVKYKQTRRVAPGRYTAADIDAQYAVQRGTCFYCPHSLAHGNYQADHYIPLSRGGTNEPSNIVLACPGCNLAKGRKLPGDFKPPK